MSYSLTIAGYEFQNPPEEYRKLIRLGNSPQPAVSKEATDFYQSDSQSIQLQVEGTLALDPPLGEEQDDLDELERLQELAIKGGSVIVDFEPFFRGDGVIVDDPFSQSAGEATYQFTIAVNAEYTNFGAYPARNPPDTGNTFELGDIDLGYDPDSVRQNYERQTEQVKRLQGIAKSVDNEGLIPEVNVSGKIDGSGQAQLWDKAKQNVLAYLSAEFQNGWCLIDSLSIRNDPEAPDYLDGLFQYDLDVMVVKNPESGIGSVSSYVDQEVKQAGTYAGDASSGDSDFTDLDFTVNGGSGSLDGDYIEWNQTTVTLSDNNTNYVYADDDESDGYGTVKVNQSAFPADSLELYRVEVSGGVITKVVDVRAILLNDRDSDEGGSTEETIAGDIYITIASGDYEMNPGVVADWESTRLLLQPNTTNYIWAEDPEADGTATVETNTTGYPGSSDFVQLYRAETDADSITNLIDDRPADISDSTTNTSGADLNLADDLRVRDQNLDFERLLALADTLAVADTDLLPALGLADLDPETMAVADGPLDARGIASFTDTPILDDGGTAKTGVLSDETVTWATASDWDGATAQDDGIVHDSFDDLPGDGVVTMGYQNSDEGGSALEVHLTGTDDSSPLTDHVGGHDYAALDGQATYGDVGLWGRDAPNTQNTDGFNNGSYDPAPTTSFSTVAWFKAFSITSTTPGHGGDADGNTITGINLQNDVWYVMLGNNDEIYGYIDTDSDIFEQTSGSSPVTTNTLHMASMTWDGSNVSVYLDDTEILNGSVSGTLVADGFPNNFIGWDNRTDEPPLDGILGPQRYYQRALSASEIAALYAAGTGGSITTGTKSFSAAVQPDLENLSYTLGDGSITVDVIGSPGTASEEVVSQTLDGATSYTLSWNSDHSDFRTRLDFSTTDLNDAAPTFSGGDLVARTGSSSDSDQNPNTTWEIQGAKYDTSGNEYEGGGMVSKYGAD